jgi:hypothetical protein
VRRLLAAAALAAFPALVAATPAAPQPSPTPRVLRTIVTVVSSPYCNALAEHFNGALRPMLANDRVFETTNVQLDDMNDMFKHPDYVQRFTDLRTKLAKETDTLVQSLKPMQEQIDALRASATLSNDPAAVQEMRDAAARLKEAHDHQFQLATDLTSLVQAMMQYDVLRGPHPLGGWTPYEQSLPADEKNIKVYLHFDAQRQSIATAEDRAVDIGYSIAENRCSKP